MTAAELNRQIEASEQQRADLLPPQPKRRTERAYRRMMNERKFKHLFRIVMHGYRPHAGYVDWSYVDGKPLLDKGGVFVHLRKYENFARVFIEYGAVCWDIDPNVDSNEVWNNRIDLCPDSCYIDKVLIIIYEVLYDKLEFWRVLTCNSTHTSLRCGLRSSATSETSPKRTLLGWRIFPRSTSAMRCKKVKLALS